METRWKIIVFEADQEYAKILRETLTIEGFDVVCLDHAPHHLEDRINQERPDIVSIDALLPDMDGFEIAVRIKRDLRTQKIPIVFLSSVSHRTDIQRSRDIGAADFIVKAKTSPRDVANRLKAVLGQPIIAIQPKVRIAQLPNLTPSSQAPATVARTSVLPNRRWLWIAGIIVVVIAGVQLSFLFSRSTPDAASTPDVSAINGTPMTYLEPAACLSDDDCRILPGCCTGTGVNLYHVTENQKLDCPAETCDTTDIGVACLNYQCGVVTAHEVTDRRIIYAAATNELSDREQQLAIDDCNKRGGEYRSCDPACDNGSTDCGSGLCASVCIEPENVLPEPGVRQ